MENSSLPARAVRRINLLTAPICKRIVSNPKTSAAGAVGGVVFVLSCYDVHLSDEQQAALGFLLIAVIGWFSQDAQ